MRSIRNVIAVVLLISGLITSCSSSNEKNEDSGLPVVVATTGMIGDLASVIAGDKVEVITLMGPGVDPHLYKATQGDLFKLQKASLVLYNGLHLEGKMGDVLEKVGLRKPVIAVAEELENNRLIFDREAQGAPDPHVWFDVSLWQKCMDPILQGLQKLAPEHAQYFARNAMAYSDSLTQLHNWVREEIASIPQEKRVLITAHDAFSYFGRAYDIQVRGLQGISTLSEFGLRDRVDLVNFIIERGIEAVFVETSVSERNIASIVEGCKQKGHEVVIGGSLYSDAMGDPGTPEGHYLGMVRANVKHIVEGLNSNGE
jgi:manganese/zinc/iron transport system substrate-binding protein